MLEVVKIRKATLDDAKAIAHVHNAAWRSAYQGIVPDDHLAALDDRKAAKRWEEILRTQSAQGLIHLIAEGSDGKVFGFAGCGRRREGPEKYDGELYAIYVDPDSQGHGVGRDLFLESCRALKKRGFRSMLVWALRKAANARFYERFGGVAVDLQQVVIGKTLEEVCWAWESLDQLIHSLEAR